MFSYCKLVILILALTLGGQGHEAVPHSRPYMVLLERYMKDGKTAYCGGFLLNEDFVMTAAHCKTESYNILLGLHDVRNSEEIQRVSVKEAFPHKDYDENGFKNDIMLLKLKTKAQFNKNVRPIALADRDDGSLPKSCTVSGWGRSNRHSKYMTPVLMEANVTLIYNEKYVKDKLYCSEGETGPAEGDAGGALVCEDGKAYGVMSFNYKPTSGGPVLHCYTKIPDNGNWIDWIMDPYTCISNVREL
ncbi:granzyme B(G,H)-like [Trachinotus anak]|uniref:granzyme B(G,H)-like n=1 Tax=Trachinotus anak TaxID=443729 RepID=UPI0039F1746D